MGNLIQTKLQKTILLIGGFLIFLNLFDVPARKSQTAILQSVGMAVFIFVLLTVLKDFKFPIAKARLVIKRIWKPLVLLLLLALLIGGIKRYQGYLVYKEFHENELAYQKCLDKVWASTIWTKETLRGNLIDIPYTKQNNKYFSEWQNDGSPFYNQSKGHWEEGFMQWMMNNHPEFCSEFNTNQIKSFVSDKLEMINGTRPSL